MCYSLLYLGRLQYLLGNPIFPCNICDLKLATYYAPFFFYVASELKKHFVGQKEVNILM